MASNNAALTAAANDPLAPEDAPSVKRLKPTSIAPVATVTFPGDVTVCAVGLGCLPAGVAYPDPKRRPDYNAFESLVLASIQGSSTQPLFIDAADTYSEPVPIMHSIERDLCEIVGNLPADVPRPILTTKSGMRRVNSDAAGWRPGDVTPDGVRASIMAARAALHSRDPNAPLFLWSLHHIDSLRKPGLLEATIAAAKECVDHGIVLHLGLCNASVEEIKRAQAVAPIACVQNEWSLYNREAEKPRPPTAAATSKKGVLAYCAEQNIIFVASQPLGGLKARRNERRLERDFPWVAKMAAELGVSPQALCLAALRLRGKQLGAQVLLIPGARTLEHAADSVASARLELTDEQVNDILG